VFARLGSSFRNSRGSTAEEKYATLAADTQKIRLVIESYQIVCPITWSVRCAGTPRNHEVIPEAGACGPSRSGNNYSTISIP
jgi:hypothetical protein